MERNYPVLTVSDKGERALRSGHPWVYGEELAPPETPIRDGEVCDVRNRKGAYLGSGFYNAHSKIRVRILSRNANDVFDDAFFARRVAYALDYRETVMGDDFDCCRLIFGEADGLPGLTVDRFGDVLAAQVMCLGTDLRKEAIFSALVRDLRRRGQTVRVLCERSEGALREKEGLPQYRGYFTGEGLVPGEGTTVIRENGLAYAVDYYDGQKTGYFLDQKYNRAAVARIARGRRVLDCFSHIGGFALNAAAAGAEHVTAADVSQAAVDAIRANAARNGLQNVEAVCVDVFDYLTELSKSGSHPYDLIVLDPPAFTKSTATVRSAERGYREINYKAMKLLPRGGYLATCSCSHFMKNDLFRKMLADAAADAQVSLRQIEARTQGPDHPILWNAPETDYLKFYLFQVV